MKKKLSRKKEVQVMMINQEKKVKAKVKIHQVVL